MINLRQTIKMNGQNWVKLKKLLLVLPSSYLTNGIHTAALKQICLVQYCRLVRPSQTSHSTALLCLTPPKASTLTNPTRMTFMRSQGPSTRADVSTENFIF